MTTPAPTPPRESPPTSTPPARRRWTSRRFRWTLRLAVIVAFMGGIKLVGLDRKFYYPNNETYLLPADLGLKHEDVYFPTSDGLTLHGWFLPASSTPRGLIIHFHGNAANVTGHLPLVEWLPAAGFHVLMFDYRGYGRSQGRVTRAGTIRDGHAALDYALTRSEAGDLPVFAYGQSLGGAVAVVVAAERSEIVAVVAESTFPSYRRIAARHAQTLVGTDWLATPIATWVISKGYDPIDVVAQLAPRPLLVIAAENDEICFPELARELYDAACQPKEFWLVPNAEHLGIHDVAPREHARRIVDFLTRAATQSRHRKI